MSAIDGFNVSGNVVVSTSEERKQLPAKGYNSWTKIGVSVALIGIVSSSGGTFAQQIAPKVQTSSIGTSFDAYNIRTERFVRTKNAGLEANRVKKTRRNVPIGIKASIEYHAQLPSHPRIDIVENFDIKPLKHSDKYTELTFSLEYAGRLPKRPRI